MAKDREQKNRKPRFDADNKEAFEQKLVDLARVTRVTKGGKRMNFRACVVIGDMKSTVGFGVAKGADVSLAINKAVAQAKKRMLKTSIKDGTLPHEIVEKYKAAIVKLRPGKSGRGIIAGGVVRTVLEMGGYRDAVAKIIGSKNKVNNVKAVMSALEKMK